jgi:hypothetical protein
MSKPTGGKPGRPPKPPTPEALPRAPRPTDPIAAIVWDMEVEASKEKPNPTRAGLLGKQLEALTRERDRADAIASDEQRIELEAARISITEWETAADESDATIEGLERECDRLQGTVTKLEGEVTNTIAVAAEDRRAYLNQCPVCAETAVIVSGLQAGLDRADALAEKCAKGQCLSSMTRQAEIDRTRGPAAQWESWDETVKSIEDERKRVIAAREHRAEVLAEVVRIKERQRMTDAEYDSLGAMQANEVRLHIAKDKKFLLDNAEIIAEDAAAKAEAEKKKEHQKWIDLRTHFGPTRMKVMLTAKRYEEIFGPDPEE